MVTTVIGREQEIAALTQFIGAVGELPGALLIEGEAGIGKTTIWEAGLRLARERGYRVMASRAGESEARLSFTALGDFFESVPDEVLLDLPEPQRTAIQVALLRVESPDNPPERRAVSLAALAVIRALLAGGPLVIAVDDLQWLDPSSARILAFVARRLLNEPIGILAAVRLGEQKRDPLTLDNALSWRRAVHLRVGPMEADQLGRLFRQRLGVDLRYPVVRRVHSMTGGNPFYALEMARELARRGLPGPGEAFPVPADLQELVRERLEALPVGTLRLLLLAASTPQPTKALLRSASEMGEGFEPALAEAERTGVVQVGPAGIGFTHPLLASSAYAMATSSEGAMAHRRLAEHVTNPEERARHLALGAEGRDAGVSSALDLAAQHAHARGAPDAAAELCELAIRLTPRADVAGIHRRSTQAAQYQFESGDRVRALALLEDLARASPPGVARAGALWSLATKSWLDVTFVRETLERAVDEEPDDPELLSHLLGDLAWAHVYAGELAEGSAYARRALSLAEESEDRGALSEALATAGMCEFLSGGPYADHLAKAVAIFDSGTGPTMYSSPRVVLGLQQLWAGDLERSRSTLQGELDRYVAQGQHTVLAEVHKTLGELECRAGSLDAAHRHTTEAVEIRLDSAGTLDGSILYPHALVAAHLGDVTETRARAEDGLRIAEQYGDRLYAAGIAAVLGFLELSLGNPATAHDWLGPVVEFVAVMGIAEPGVIPCAPDEIEALMALGQLDAAEAVLEAHEETTRALDRPWAVATAARCRGLLLATRGNLEGARDALGFALNAHERVAQPLELGRTLLVLGEVERRAKHKRAARSSLEQALGIFDQVGAALWSAKARAELARVGGGSAANDLTPTERRVVELVVEGRTNREVAGALFVTVKTVEANLTRIFRKLRVRSRAELIRRALVATSPSPDRQEPRPPA